MESICQNSSCYWLVCNDNIEDDGLLVGGQFYGEYNGKQSILVLRSYHPAITLLHFTGVFWSDCRHSYSLVVSDFVSHMALDFWKDSLCKRRRRVTYHVPYQSRRIRHPVRNSIPIAFAISRAISLESSSNVSTKLVMSNFHSPSSSECPWISYS